MAAIAAPAPVIPPQDPLLEALTKYITTGVNATAATADEVQKVFNHALAQPGGRAYVESLCSSNDVPSFDGDYKTHYQIQGLISMTKMNMDLNLNVGQTASKFSGSAMGVFTPQTSMLSGIIRLKTGDDDISPGVATYTIWAHGTTVYIKWYRNSVEVAIAVFVNAPVQLPTHAISGSGSWS